MSLLVFEVLTLGRKLTIKDKAATEAALEILKTSKRHPLRVQLVRLLYESDAREKARADTREKRRQSRAHNKKVAGLQSEFAALQEQLQEKENTIASLKAERDKDLQSFQAQLESKAQAIAHLKEQLNEAKTCHPPNWLPRPKEAHKQRWQRNYAECRILTGLGPPYD